VIKADKVNSQNVAIDAVSYPTHRDKPAMNGAPFDFCLMWGDQRHGAPAFMPCRNTRGNAGRRDCDSGVTFGDVMEFDGSGGTPAIYYGWRAVAFAAEWDCLR
jgi:hypothetical protein